MDTHHEHCQAWVSALAKWCSATNQMANYKEFLLISVTISHVHRCAIVLQKALSLLKCLRNSSPRKCGNSGNVVAEGTFCWRTSVILLSLPFVHTWMWDKKVKIQLTPFQRQKMYLQRTTLKDWTCRSNTECCFSLYLIIFTLQL